MLSLSGGLEVSNELESTSEGGRKNSFSILKFCKFFLFYEIEMLSIFH
jgi:hypothetical protein